MTYLTRGSLVVRDGHVVDILDPEFQEWVLAGNTPVPEPLTPQEALVNDLQVLMDSQARSLGYDDLKTAITYRGDPNPKFAAEAEAMFLWRSSVWTTAYAILADVQAGTRSLPPPSEAIDLMPPLNLN